MTRTLLIAAVSIPLLMLGLSGAAASSGPWLPVDAVDPFAAAGNTIYAGGEFRGFWQPSPSATLALYQGGRPSPYASFAAPHTGGVSAVVADSSGGWFAGGSFSSLGGVHCRNLVHVLANGTVGTRGCPRPASVSLRGSQ